MSGLFASSKIIFCAGIVVVAMSWIPNFPQTMMLFQGVLLIVLSLLMPRDIRLPPVLIKVVQLCGVLGMATGILISWAGGVTVGWSIFNTVGLGLIFTMSAKYLMGKWMYYWMETKLEVASREKEAAKRLEEANREERRKKAEEESARIRAELAAGRSPLTKPPGS